MCDPPAGSISKHSSKEATRYKSQTTTKGPLGHKAVKYVELKQDAAPRPGEEPEAAIWKDPNPLKVKLLCPATLSRELSADFFNPIIRNETLPLSTCTCIHIYTISNKEKFL